MTSRKKAKEKTVPQQLYFRRKADRDLVHQAADITGASISQFIRDVAVREAKRVLADNQQLTA